MVRNGRVPHLGRQSATVLPAAAARGLVAATLAPFWHILALISLFTIPFAAATLLGWRAATGDTGTRQHALATALFAIVAFVIAITHVYETVFLLRDWESDRLRSVRLEHARLQTELESLGREVDPHFLFNNLNALTHLIERRSDAAPWFVRTLSATYEYVLDCRGRTLVPLAEELQALERHRALAEIRYGGNVHLDVQVQPADAEPSAPAPCLAGGTFSERVEAQYRRRRPPAAHPGSSRRRDAACREQPPISTRAGTIEWNRSDQHAGAVPAGDGSEYRLGRRRGSIRCQAATGRQLEWSIRQALTTHKREWSLANGHPELEKPMRRSSQMMMKTLSMCACQAAFLALVALASPVSGSNHQPADGA